jgi:hypothetical protein
VLVDSEDFVMHFLDEALSQDVAHINDRPLLRYTHAALAFYFHVLLVDIFISFKQYLLPFYFFWQVSTRKLCKYLGTLWV